MLIFTVIYYIPIPKEKQQKLFTANLVTPEELRKLEIKPPEPKIRPPPTPPPVTVKPVLPPLPPQPPKSPVEGKPIVPGEGKKTGRPLPEGKYPKFSDQDKEGQEKSTAEKLQSKPLEKPGFLDTKQLYDKGIIDTIAKKEVAGKRKPDKSIAFDTSDYKYLGYQTLLRHRLEDSGCWVYPREAAEQGIYGDLLIRFTIKKNGTLGSVELIRTSGYQSLDDAAMKALRDCGPYWPLPDEWGMEEYPTTGHFIYVLGGSFFR